MGLKLMLSYSGCIEKKYKPGFILKLQLQKVNFSGISYFTFGDKLSFN